MATVPELALLHGACSCGRNRFYIVLPPDPALARQTLEVVVDDSAEGRE